MGYFNSDYFEMKAVGDCDRHDSAEEDNFSQVTNFYTKVRFGVAILNFKNDCDQYFLLFAKPRCLTTPRRSAWPTTSPSTPPPRRHSCRSGIRRTTFH